MTYFVNCGAYALDSSVELARTVAYSCSKAIVVGSEVGEGTFAAVRQWSDLMKLKDDELDNNARRSLPLTEEEIAYIEQLKEIDVLMPSWDQFMVLNQQSPPPQEWFDEIVTDER